MKNKLLILICLLLAFTSLLVGCNHGDDSISENSGSVESSFEETSEEISGEKSEDTQNILYKDLEKKDLNGRVFNVIERKCGLGKESIDFSGEVLYMEDDDGTLDFFNQGKKDIIEQIQKDYNCTIKGEIYAEGGSNTVANLKALITADAEAKTGKYDFFFETPYYYFSMIEKGYLKNIKNISTINLESNCWDKNAVDDFSINGGLYFINGDINTYDNSGSIVLLFNQKLYESLGYKENVYTLVKEMKWTFDKLAGLAAEFTTADLNENNVADEFDSWFLGSETSNLYVHIIASDNGICSKDEKGMPQISINTDTAIDACLKAYELLFNSGKVLIADSIEFLKKYPENGACYTETTEKAFLEGREVFFATILSHVPYYRETGMEFGIVPFPMYSEAQGRYISAESIHSTTSLMIPNTPCANEDLGIIVQALAELSEEKLTPLYYDKLLNGTNGRDEKSEEILDLIFKNKKYDLGAIAGYEWPYTSLFHENDPLWCAPTLSDICTANEEALKIQLESILKMQDELEN